MEFAYFLLTLFVLGISLGLWLLDPSKKEISVEEAFYVNEPKMRMQKWTGAYDPKATPRILRKFETWTKPMLPYKRKRTDEEDQVMSRFYKDFGWSDIDAEGKIVLNGGECTDGIFYITEEDLAEMVKRLT